MVLRSWILRLVTVAGCLTSVQGWARFGVIDMQSVILNVDEGKKARAELEKEIKEKEKEIVKEREALDKLNEEWKSQAAVLSEAAKLEKQQKFQERFMALRNQEMAMQQEIKRKEQKATQGIAVKVAKLVEDYAKNKDLEGVFELSTAGIVYLKNPMDLTKDIIAAYGKAKPGKDVAKKDEAKKADEAKKPAEEKSEKK